MQSEVEARILESFLKACQALDELNEHSVSFDTSVCDLGIDSIVLLEIIGYVEDELNINIAEEDLIAVNTVGDISKLVAIQLY